VCDGGGLENPVVPVDHFKTVPDRKVLIPPVGYTVMDVPMSVDMSDVKTRSEILLSGREKGGKIALQLPSGWITNGILVGICDGECPHHSSDKRDWAWVRFAADDEYSSIGHLCELDNSYGQDSGNFWCILVPDLMAADGK
jgi:hypothetical protein